MQSSKVFPQASKILQRIYRGQLSYRLKVMPMDAIDDEKACILRSRAGDPEGFETLVRLHQRMIHSLAYRMTGSLADAEDLAQEVFIRAHGQFETYREEAKFSSWLYRIALNACLNWRWRETRRGQVHREWAEATATAPMETSSKLDASELQRQVQECLLKLPAKQRAAIVLTVYEEMSHAEAAHALGCSETTISWRVFAARNKLKRWLRPARHEKPGR
jgi:RNA polymerase sigma-70 factor (ECF subfamily)